jgi:hypothetical protein
MMTLEAWRTMRHETGGRRTDGPGTVGRMSEGPGTAGRTTAGRETDERTPAAVGHRDRKGIPACSW